MIIKINHRGSAPQLMRYLFGPGNDNEHGNQHVVAVGKVMGAFEGHAVGETCDGMGEAARMGRRLEASMKAFGKARTEPKRQYVDGVPQVDADGNPVKVPRPAHVWHAAVALPPEDGVLPDEKWNEIAHDIMRRMGFERNEPLECFRWVAVRHGLSKNGNDHIHIAAIYFDETGTKWRVPEDLNRRNRDFEASKKLARELEVKHGLTQTKSRGKKTGRSRQDTLGELAEAKKDYEREHGKPFPFAAVGDAHEWEKGSPRPLTRTGRLEVEVRAALACASDEADFVRELRSRGVLVRPRWKKGSNRTRVEGYSVGFHEPADGKTIWRAPSKMGSDLGLGLLRMKRWGTGRDETPAQALAEWAMCVDKEYGKRLARALYAQRARPPDADEAGLWDEVAGLVEQTADQLSAASSWDEFADVCHDAAGYYAVLADRLGPRGWRVAQTSRALGRAAQYYRRKERRDPDSKLNPRYPAMKSLAHTREFAGIPKRAISAFDILNAAIVQGFLIRQDRVEADRYMAEVETTIGLLREMSAAREAEMEALAERRRAREAIDEGEFVFGEDGQLRYRSGILDDDPNDSLPVVDNAADGEAAPAQETTAAAPSLPNTQRLATPHLDTSLHGTGEARKNPRRQ